MSVWDNDTNDDCKSCGYGEYKDISSDYEEYSWYCRKEKVHINFTSCDNKACGLSAGEYYVANINKIKK